MDIKVSIIRISVPPFLISASLKTKQENFQSKTIIMSGCCPKNLKITWDNDTLGMWEENVKMSFWEVYRMSVGRVLGRTAFIPV